MPRFDRIRSVVRRFNTSETPELSKVDQVIAKHAQRLLDVQQTILTSIMHLNLRAFNKDPKKFGHRYREIIRNLNYLLYYKFDALKLQAEKNSHGAINPDTYKINTDDYQADITRINTILNSADKKTLAKYFKSERFKDLLNQVILANSKEAVFGIFEAFEDEILTPELNRLMSENAQDTTASAEASPPPAGDQPQTVASGEASPPLTGDQPQTVASGEASPPLTGDQPQTVASGEASPPPTGDQPQTVAPTFTPAATADTPPPVNPPEAGVREQPAATDQPAHPPAVPKAGKEEDEESDQIYRDEQLRVAHIMREIRRFTLSLSQQTEPDASSDEFRIYLQKKHPAELANLDYFFNSLENFTSDQHEEITLLVESDNPDPQAIANFFTKNGLGIFKLFLQQSYQSFRKLPLIWNEYLAEKNARLVARPKTKPAWLSVDESTGKQKNIIKDIIDILHDTKALFLDGVDPNTDLNPFFDFLYGDNQGKLAEKFLYFKQIFFEFAPRDFTKTLKKLEKNKGLYDRKSYAELQDMFRKQGLFELLAQNLETLEKIQVAWYAYRHPIQTKQALPEHFQDDTGYSGNSSTFFKSLDPKIKAISKKIQLKHSPEFKYTLTTFHNTETNQDNLRYSMQGDPLIGESRLVILAELIDRANTSRVFDHSIDVQGTLREVQDTLDILFVKGLIRDDGKPLNITIIGQNNQPTQHSLDAYGPNATAWDNAGLYNPLMITEERRESLRTIIDSTIVIDITAEPDEPGFQL